MSAKQISTEHTRAESSHSSRIDRNTLLTVILGLLAAAGTLVLILQVNRSLEVRIQAAEVWSDYQVKIVKASVEEDPNLRQQYAEEQDLLRRHAEDLKQLSTNTRHDVKFSLYGAVLLLIGTSIAILGLLAGGRAAPYLGLVLGMIGVGLSLTTLI